MIYNRRQFVSRSLSVAIGAQLSVGTLFARDSDRRIVTTSAGQLAEQIRKRQLSSVEVVQAFLNRIEEVNPAINAVVQKRASEALGEARAADRRVEAGEVLGSLHGVPFTIKDNIETEGIVTTCGMPELKDHKPENDATVVKRLKAAGGILLGKTNVPEFCLFEDTNNAFYGRTKNPHDLLRITGGSSGGEAAIIASCGSPFGIGTDIGGSIRTPSHYCGVAGLKPSRGRVPETGVLNCFPPANWHWNSTGPMARYVSDLKLILGVISNSDSASSKSGSQYDTVTNIDGLRVAYFTDDGVSKPADEVQQAVRDSALHLSKLGADVTEVRPDNFAQAYDLWFSCLDPNLATNFRLWKEEFGRLGGNGVSEEYSPIANWMLRWQDFMVGEGRYTAAKRFRSGLLLRSFLDEMSNFFKEYDVIVCPVANEPAQTFSDSPDQFPPMEDVYEQLIASGGLSYLNAFNLTGSPSAVVPAAKTSDGLPVGVQIAGPPRSDERVLDVAEKIEQGVGGWTMPQGT